MRLPGTSFSHTNLTSLLLKIDYPQNISAIHRVRRSVAKIFFGKYINYRVFTKSTHTNKYDNKFSPEQEQYRWRLTHSQLLPTSWDLIVSTYTTNHWCSIHSISRRTSKNYGNNWKIKIELTLQWAETEIILLQFLVLPLVFDFFPTTGRGCWWWSYGGGAGLKLHSKTLPGSIGEHWNRYRTLFPWLLS